MNPEPPSAVREGVSFRGQYRYAASHRWGAVAVTLCFVAWWGGLLWAYSAGVDASMRRITPGGLLMLISVPFGMMLLSLFWLNQVFGGVDVDAEGIEVRGLVGSKRRQFPEFDRLEPMGSNREGFILWTHEGTPFKVATPGLLDAKDLRDYVKSRLVPGPRLAVEETEFRVLFPKPMFAIAAILSLFFAALPWLLYGARTDALTLHVVFDFLALLIGVAVVQAATTRAQIFPDRVVKRHAFGTQTVRFADVKRVETEVMMGKGGSVEVIRLVNSGRDLTFSAQFQHFTGLRDALVARSKNAKILDSRPADYR